MLGPDGRVLAEVGQGIGVATNNVAEYRAAIEALRQASVLGATDVLLRSDSKLLVEQLSGRFRVRNQTLAGLHTEVRSAAHAFSSVAFEHVPRELNHHADRLANVGVDAWLRSRHQTRPAPRP